MSQVRSFVDTIIEQWNHVVMHMLGDGTFGLDEMLARLEMEQTLEHFARNNPGMMELEPQATQQEQGSPISQYTPSYSLEQSPTHSEEW